MIIVDPIRAGVVSREMVEFPKIVNLEVYRGGCPCGCVHCPVGATAAEKRKEIFGKKGIDLDLYKKIMDEITEHSFAAVRIHSVGEPLMWDNLVDALKLHSHSLKSWLFTSGVTNDPSLLEAICETIHIVEVSVNSTASDDYKNTKGMDAFDRVCKNIGYMHSFIKKNGLHTRLIVSRVQSRDKIKDAEFVRYWKASGLVNDSFVRSYHTYNDLIEELEPGKTRPTHEPCLVHWARFNISVDGYAVVCFNELFKESLDASLILGDVNRQTIAEIWRGEKLAALREAELSGNYSGISSNDALPCKDCYSCQPLFGGRQTSEHQIKQIGGLHV